MKLISLHAKNTAILYKNSICSLGTIVVLVFIGLSVMVPVFLVTLLSPYSGIADSSVHFEQPHIDFKHQSIFHGDLAGSLDDDLNATSIACSSFENFNIHMEEYTTRCAGFKYWSEDVDSDNTIDRSHFEIELNLTEQQILKRFEIILFFEASLKHKCKLSPPALLSHTVHIPSIFKLGPGNISLKGELQLKQYAEFKCPFPGQLVRTNFSDINKNGSIENDIDLEEFQSEFLLNELKSNPAYFKISIDETYFRPDIKDTLTIHLSFDILPVPARYHLCIWERLVQFWLYFASFFVFTFYIMNRIKDFLFGNHIIRSLELIPWKKLY